MKRTILLTFALLAATGCSPASRSPDAIRHDTAAATAAAARDAKAVAQGVFDGLKTKGPLNINKASVDDLQTLPGIDPVTARKIVAGRPYNDSNDLRKRHLVSKAEFDRIATKITAR